MTGSCCNIANEHFSRDKVAKELLQYRRKGAGPTTRRLRDGLASAGLTDGTLLDIGGGLGVLSHELLDAGMSRAVVVDASSAYLDAASLEAVRRGRSLSMQFVNGDFLLVAPQLAGATIVTLDRVVCCYPLCEPLLAEALQRAERGFAFSYPRDRWYVKVGNWLENTLRRWRGSPFRTFVHAPREMTAMIENAGFTLASRRLTLAWSADVFVKSP